MIGAAKLWLKLFEMNFHKKDNKNILVNSLQKNNFICLAIIIVIFLFDRISKIKIINHQLDNNRIFINDIINFELVWNTGIGFGLLSSNSNLIYNTITIIIFLVLIFISY